jgi:hypothetical protein
MTRTDEDAYRQFLNLAEGAAGERTSVVHAMLRTGSVAGTWHPNGFATFEIELVDGLGLIRLHVWARHLRRSVPRHPEIHSHSFPLYSRVLCGTYRENQYEASETTAAGGMCAYRVVPTGRGGPDVLQPSESRYTATPILAEDAVFPAGSWHDLPAGVFHSTLIPPDDFCATIAVLGRHLPGVTDVLLGEAGFEQLNRSRARLTPAELTEIRRQFNAESQACGGR